MNLRSIYRRHYRTLWPLMALLSLLTIALALAQTPEMKMASVITIDGAQNPDRIPDWILWREIFRTVSALSENSASKGDEIWLDNLHFSRTETNNLIGVALNHGSMDSAKSLEAKNLKASAKETKESRRIKLRQTQMSMEVEVLKLRDTLRARIGDDAFARLQSYAKLNIAPSIKVGNLVRK